MASAYVGICVMPPIFGIIARYLTASLLPWYMGGILLVMVLMCEQLNRKCRMMELDEHYCDVIRRRWAEFKYGEGCDWQSLTPEA
jgi:fucose permease